MFRDEVAARYAAELTDVDRAEFEDFVSRETERLTAEFAALQADLETQLRDEARARLGRPLEYVETVSVLAKRDSARAKKYGRNSGKATCQHLSRTRTIPN